MTTTTATKWLLAAQSPFPCGWRAGTKPDNRTTMRIRMARDNTKSRMPLQRGRILSIEAIQAVQSLKRAKPQEINQVLNFKFLRLLKRDMVAVLRELLRQNNCPLALMVFEEIRKELWYRPQVSLYAEMVTVFANNGFFEEVELLCSYLNSERDFLPELEGFNALFRSLLRFKLVGLVMECYKLMRSLGGEPDRSLYRVLINGLESMGERWQCCIVRWDAQKDFGESLEFLEEEEEEEEVTLSHS
ncbi:Vacuolar sorting protein 9 domain [Tripterygium wilfordii]|uniref:Vacuolar sorting protein 9 domain n=1 Tax=Tripterygium wilfordii TaxID=458696 RepID=A0A7J7DIE4_TRIWF|nr:protein THYLAKOID ASSEMBLY 8, chloroplastic-like [Tripterygium wilfordii]KAF5745826.1 Vacuolar sorting protein 9 domain [Tripterygium wilfordii]